MRIDRVVILALSLSIATVVAVLPENDVRELQSKTETLFASRRDLRDAKLCVDQMVDPATNVPAAASLIDDMADVVRPMAGENAGSAASLHKVQ